MSCGAPRASARIPSLPAPTLPHRLRGTALAHSPEATDSSTHLSRLTGTDRSRGPDRSWRGSHSDPIALHQPAALRNVREGGSGRGAPARSVSELAPSGI